MASWGGSDNCDRDTFVEQAQPDDNKDTQDLTVAYDNTGKTVVLSRILAYWDFSASGIASADVTSAYIYLNLHTGIIPEEFLTRWDRVGAGWVEDEVTWNTQPAITGDYSGKNAPFAAGWNYWDVNVDFGGGETLIKDAIDNRSSILDVMLLTTDYKAATAQSATFYDSEEVPATASRPYLIINYSVAGGASRNRGYVFGSRLGGLHLPDLPRGWLRRRGLVVPSLS